MQIQRATETEANVGLESQCTCGQCLGQFLSARQSDLMRNIITPHPNSPTREVLQWKYRKFGLKLGAEERSRQRQEMLTAQ